jgi:hypothetical protein
MKISPCPKWLAISKQGVRKFPGPLSFVFQKSIINESIKQVAQRFSGKDHLSFRIPDQVEHRPDPESSIYHGFLPAQE